MVFVPSGCRSTEVNSGSAAPGDPVVCKAEDSFRSCSVALDDPAGFATLLSVSVSGSVAPNVLLEVPARPGEWPHSLGGVCFVTKSLSWPDSFILSRLIDRLMS